MDARNRNDGANIVEDQLATRMQNLMSHLITSSSSAAAAAAAAAPTTTTTTTAARARANPLTGEHEQERRQQQSVGGGIYEFMSMETLDKKFTCLGCLGHGGFGSVFLAEKRSSGSKVALKVFRTGGLVNSISDVEGADDDNDEDEEIYGYEAFSREVDTLLKLEDGPEPTAANTAEVAAELAAVREMGSQHCIFAKDWFHGPNFACIVMNYVDGGTLAQQIDDRRRRPYTERRIAWYASQLSAALAHAHSCGVIHYDVKSSNVLVDRSEGGRLVLADFGSAVSPGDVGRSFSKEFAPPELFEAIEQDDFTGIDGEKVDAFGLGCILFELICCKRIIDFEGEETIGQYIGRVQNANAVLDLPDVALSWQLSQNEKQNEDSPRYSLELRYMIEALLKPTPQNRYNPSSVATALRTDDRSPVIADYCSAQNPLCRGAPVTIDNLQLGMFVLQGKDWSDGFLDAGSVGVIVELDFDGEYTWAAFSNRTDPVCCRIGAKNKFELSVGPTEVEDTLGIRRGGLVPCNNPLQFCVGHPFNSKFTVVRVNEKRSNVLITPIQKYHEVAFIQSSHWYDEYMTTATVSNIPRKPDRIPRLLSQESGLLVRIVDGEERKMVEDIFFDPNRGMNRQNISLVSVEATLSNDLWDSFSSYSETVAIQNWSNQNQKRLFFGTRAHDVRSMVQTLGNFDQMMPIIHSGLHPNLSPSAKDACSDAFCVPFSRNSKIVVLSRVSLGRIEIQQSGRNGIQGLSYHSKELNGRFSVNDIHQILPEYLITYRETVRAVRPRHASPRHSLEVHRSSTFRPSVTVGPPGSTPPLRRSSSQPVHHTALRSSPDPTPQSTPTITAAPASPELPQTAGGMSIKVCVVCMDLPVSRFLYPCGHVCLCENCSSLDSLVKLKLKCPECRKRIKKAIKIYATVVE